MADAPLQPLTFRPVYKDYLWGGDRIPRRFARPVPPGIYAESWEVSAHPGGLSIVADGPFAGRSLADLVHDHPQELLGAAGGPGGEFPILVKLIDAHALLSVQVHPDDANAALTGGEPKTEMWHILEADAGARLFAGLKPGTTPERLQAAVDHGSVETVLQSLPARAGDTFFIPGGLVHALDRGPLLLEVQQSSNTTYRLYDWGRVDKDGRPRETHMAQALKVIRWDLQPGRPAPRPMAVAAPNRAACLHPGPFFRLERFELNGPLTEPGRDSGFAVLFVARGRLRLTGTAAPAEYAAGTSILIPACLPPQTLAPAAGACDILRITVPRDRAG